MDSYGIERQGRSAHTPHQKPARYLVVIDAGGSGVAMLFLETRELVAEFDAGTEEVTQMTSGLVAAQSAGEPEWDKALAGHSATARAHADVYTLDI